MVLAAMLAFFTRSYRRISAQYLAEAGSGADDGEAGAAPAGDADPTDATTEAQLRR